MAYVEYAIPYQSENRGWLVVDEVFQGIPDVLVEFGEQYFCLLVSKESHFQQWVILIIANNYKIIIIIINIYKLKYIT
jgi:hypothetical protein